MPRKRPYSPRSATVRPGAKGQPAAVQDIAVEQVKEEWLVEDGWWTGTPLRRHYFELVLSDGRNLVVYRDEAGVGPGSTQGHWYLQRA